jgi:cold shock CspA family protein
MAKKGTLRWLNKTTGYGLIRPDGRGRNLFVRTTELVIDEAEQPLEEGTEVSYEVKQGANGMRAITVSRRRRYSWRDDSLKRQEGKEARNAYYAGLEGPAPLG